LLRETFSSTSSILLDLLGEASKTAFIGIVEEIIGSRSEEDVALALIGHSGRNASDPNGGNGWNMFLILGYEGWVGAGNQSRGIGHGIVSCLEAIVDQVNSCVCVRIKQS
jgi:hypothetical protein